MPFEWQYLIVRQYGLQTVMDALSNRQTMKGVVMSRTVSRRPRTRRSALPAGIAGVVVVVIVVLSFVQPLLLANPLLVAAAKSAVTVVVTGLMMRVLHIRSRRRRVPGL
ncbi:hypothetical protein [Kitasatospora sp. NPDC002965]|uniref:hypothetical protein n=1 Tax=Kitasatospora sp. NPDC002965 TaxID=3154775 RepID=UPI0033B4428E